MEIGLACQGEESMPEKMRLVDKPMEAAAEAREEKYIPKAAAEGYKKAKKLANETEESLEAGVKTVANALKSPKAKVTAGVLGAGLAALIAASLIGAGEVAVVGGAGYLAYRWLTRKTE